MAGNGEVLCPVWHQPEQAHRKLSRMAGLVLGLQNNWRQVAGPRFVRERRMAANAEVLLEALGLFDWGVVGAHGFVLSENNCRQTALSWLCAKSNQDVCVQARNSAPTTKRASHQRSPRLLRLMEPEITRN